MAWRSHGVGDGVEVVPVRHVQLHGWEAGAVVVLLLMGPGIAAHAGQVQASL